MSDNQQLLKEYAKDGSEAAIRELIERHINLVYSTAIRLVDGNTQLAQDVTQTVFLHLIRNAGKLARKSTLAGWLHRDACFVAAKTMRGERRRQTREREAAFMQSLQDHTEANLELAMSFVDDAINQLSGEDRAAILLRFFEKRDFRAIGEAMGTTEDAARMRVGRALDKLRLELNRRRVVISTVALSTLLAEHAVTAASAGLAAQITANVLKAASATGSLPVLFLKIMASIKIKLAIGSAIVLALALTPSFMKIVSRNRGQVAAAAPDLTAMVQARPPLDSTPAETSSQPSAATTDAIVRAKLRLLVLDAVDGKPVRSVQVFAGSDKPITSTDRNGQVDVAYTPGTGKFELFLRKELFADTRLLWEPNNGDLVPAEYTVRLSRAIKLSGQVLGPGDQPVEGAKVGFNHEEAPDSRTRPSSHEFRSVATMTDSQGRWEITRVAQDMLYRLYGDASHAEYLGAPLVFLGRDHEAAKQLLDGTHVFRLGAATNVSGFVVDAKGQPIADASVLAGHIGEYNRRETKTGADGAFVLKGCAVAKTLLSAEASGYAATTQPVDFSTNTGPYKLVLQGGKTLQLKVVDRAGNPIAGANVRLNTFGNRADGSTPPTQTDFSPVTDVEGRVIWDSAPDKDLQFDFAAKGFMRQGGVTIHPDGQEHVVTMTPALVISGTVRDAVSGQTIPNFKLVYGWPEYRYFESKSVPRWSTLDRFTVGFNNGVFRHTLEEEVFGGRSNCLFKIEAEGYSTYVSRLIQLDEGEVQFDVRLQRAAQRTIKVVLSDGTPAIGAVVALVTQESRFHLVPGGFDRTLSAGILLTVGEDGTVRFTSDDMLIKIIAASPQGYGELPAQNVQNSTVLAMRPWGRIEATYNPMPPSDSPFEFTLQYPDDAGSQVVMEIDKFKVATDAAGNFSWPLIPPSRVELVQLKGMSQRPTGIYVDVVAGQASKATFPGGYTVTARLILPQGVDAPAFAMVHTPSAEPPPEAANDRAAYSRWFQSPQFLAENRKVRSYPMMQMSDGTRVAKGVPAGISYVFESAIIDPLDKTNIPRIRLYEIKVPFNVPSDPTTGTIDLGEIELTPVEAQRL